jgi:hypothetical protein
MDRLEKMKSRLEDSKQKLKEREKVLKEKEKRASKNTLSTLGKLVVKGRASHLDHEALIGALLEIAEKSKDENTLIAWREKSKQHAIDMVKKGISIDGSAITISFENPPTAETRKKLKELNFKWNAFRSEYYGFGDKNELTSWLEDQQCKIETIG